MMKSRDISISGYRPRESNPGFRRNLRQNYQLRYGDSIKIRYCLRGVTGSSTAGYNGILGSIPGADIRRQKYLQISSKPTCCLDAKGRPTTALSRKQFKSMLAHDAVAAALSHKHCPSPIIHVGAGLLHCLIDFFFFNFVRNSLVALLEALCAGIFSLDS